MERAGELGDGRALGLQDEVLLDPPGLQLGQDVQRGCAPVELVLTRLQTPGGAPEPGQDDEARAASNPAGLLQTISDLQDAVVGWNLHEDWTGLERIGGRRDFVAQKGDDGDPNEHEEGDDGTQPHDFPV